MEPDSDVARLAAILGVAKEHGYVIGALTVGGLKIAFAGRALPPDPTSESPRQAHAAAQLEALEDGERATDEEMRNLRRKAKELLGHIPADADLLRLRGAL